MSRFSYIPLDIKNINSGTERELVLDKDNKNLYILDDYKVPISPIKDIRNNINVNFTNVTDFDSEVLSCKKEYELIMIKIILITNEIMKLSNYVNSISGKIDNVSEYYSYLNERYNDALKSFNYLESLIEDTFNNYTSNITKILEDIEKRKNDTKTKVNFTINKYNSSINKIIEFKDKVKMYLNQLKDKLENLPTITGKFSGFKEETVEVTKSLTTYFFWLSNNTSTYPGYRPNPKDNYKTNYTGSYKYSKAPINPYNFTASVVDVPNKKYKPSQYYTKSYLNGRPDTPKWLTPFTYSGFDSLAEACKFFYNEAKNYSPVSGKLIIKGDGGKNVLSKMVWSGNVINNKGYGFYSHTTKSYNKYGRKVLLTYEKKVKSTVKKNFSFNF